MQTIAHPLTAFLLQIWRRLSKAVLRPDHPFALHKLLFAAAYKGWDAGWEWACWCWMKTRSCQEQQL